MQTDTVVLDTEDAEEPSSTFGRLRMTIKRLVGVANLSASLAAVSVSLPSTGQAGGVKKELLMVQSSFG